MKVRWVISSVAVVAVVAVGALAVVIEIQEANEGPRNRIILPPPSTPPPEASTIDPRYWCPGLGYCDFPQPSRDPRWPRTYTGRVITHTPSDYPVSLPLTFNIHIVSSARGLLTSGDGPCNPEPNRSCSGRGPSPEWFDGEWQSKYGFPDYPSDPDELGYLRCRYITELRGSLYARIGQRCDLYLPYTYGRRDEPSVDGYGIAQDPTPLLVLEDSISYGPRELPGDEFWIERVGWIGDTQGTVIHGQWCTSGSGCAINHTFQVVALPGTDARPPGVTEETVYAANRVAQAFQDGEMTKEEANRTLLDVFIGLRIEAVTWIVRNMPVYDEADGTWSSFESYAIELGRDSGISPNSRLATDPVGTAVDIAFGDATADDMIAWMGLSDLGP